MNQLELIVRSAFRHILWITKILIFFRVTVYLYYCIRIISSIRTLNEPDKNLTTIHSLTKLCSKWILVNTLGYYNRKWNIWNRTDDLWTRCFTRELSTVYTVKKFRNRFKSRSLLFSANESVITHGSIWTRTETFLYLPQLWLRISHPSCVFISDYYLIINTISYFIYFCLSSYLFRMPKMNLDYKISKKHQLP